MLRGFRMASTPPERVATPFPDRIGRYELLLPIGSGGLATVFLSRGSGVGGFERDVAIKILHAHLREDEESKLHLLDEARLAARIRHANVVPVLEVDETPFGVYLVLDYVEGDSLSGLMRAAKAAKIRMPLPVVARILSDTLAGLHAAHELTNEAGRLLGLVHRDCTPQNILVGIDGVSRLSDFSVAKAADRAVRTRTGLVKGKIAYMSPEQARGHLVDRRCDVWAAGVVAWELIAWRRLHKKIDAVSTLLSVVTEVPPRLKDVYPEVPPALDEVVAGALEMDPERRIASAHVLRRELEDAFRASTGIADAQEVGELVTKLFGTKLRERRERAAEVRRLRARMGEIARPTDTDDPLSSRPHHERVDSSELTRRDGPQAHAAAALDLDVSRTDVGVSTASAASAMKPRRRGLVVAVGAVTATVALGAVALIVGFTKDNGTGSQAPAAEAPPPVATSPVHAAPPPGETAVAPAALASTTASVPPIAASASPSSPARATRARVRSQPEPKQAEPASRAPGMNPNNPF